MVGGGGRLSVPGGVRIKAENVSAQPPTNEGYRRGKGKWGFGCRTSSTRPSPAMCLGIPSGSAATEASSAALRSCGVSPSPKPPSENPGGRRTGGARPSFCERWCRNGFGLHTNGAVGVAHRQPQGPPRRPERTLLGARRSPLPAAGGTRAASALHTPLRRRNGRRRRRQGVALLRTWMLAKRRDWSPAALCFAAVSFSQAVVRSTEASVRFGLSAVENRHGVPVQRFI